MTLKQFTTINGSKILVNMDLVYFISQKHDTAEYLTLYFTDNYYVDVKYKLKSIMRWNQKQNQAKKAQIVEIPRVITTLLTNDDSVHNKDNQRLLI